MKTGVITDARQIDSTWLTAVLTRTGALRSGSVSDVTFDVAQNSWSRSARMTLQYAAGSTGDLPESLFLKICVGDNAVFGSSEVDYYAHDYIDLADAPIPICYDAQYSDAPPAYHILMEDLSATHRNNWQTTPTLAYGCAVARALAALHAHWWGAERLRAIGGAIPGERELTRYIEHIRPGLQPLLASVGDDIDGSSQQALLDVFDRHPAEMLQRTYDTAGFTLVHGDVNPGNILSPLDGPGKTYLVDRQPFDWSLTTWLGVSDIAYMIVHWWPTELRRQWEFLILRAYHTSLDQRGVRGYSWERLVDDYRLTAVQSLYVATEWCVLEADRTSMRWVWFPQLQKALAAYFDLYR